MKKKYLFILIIILLFLVSVYLGYKIYYVNYYDLSHIENFEKIKENFVINEETITIQTTKLPEEEYLVFKNMKLINDFKDFEIMSSSENMEIKPADPFIWYVLKDKETNKGIAAIGIAQGPSLFEEFKQDSYIFGDKKVGETKNMSDVFEKYNITSDIEFYEFIEKTKNDKNSIFDSVKDMRNFYTIHLLNTIANSNTEGIKLIDGDYEGYMINHHLDKVYIKEYNILKDGKRYTLTFNGLEYFTEEKIQDLLNTLVIE